MIMEEFKHLNPNLYFHSNNGVNYTKLIQFIFLLSIYTLTSCMHRTVNYVDQDGETFYIKSNSDIDHEYNYGVSCDYLQNDYVSWKAEDNDEYNDFLMNKMVFLIGITSKNGYLLKNLKCSIENIETKEKYIEDGLLYDGKYPFVRYDNIDKFIQDGINSDHFRISIYYDEEKMKDLKNARISVYALFEKEGDQKIISFSRDVERKIGVISFLSKGWL